MKILAIAYACEPNRGSEPGVGWNWVRQVSKSENVEMTVITRANNQKVIENFYRKNAKDNTRFLYYDLPESILKYKSGDRGIKFFFSMWQLGVIRYIKKNHLDKDCDIVWDFNFGSLALPTFCYRLKKKFFIGPVSTKESIPESYISLMERKERVKYKIQQYMRTHLWTNPITWHAMKRASFVLTCNEMSRKYLPKGTNSVSVFHNGLDLNERVEVVDHPGRTLRMVCSGRLIKSKNIDVAIEAINQLKPKKGDLILSIYGSGAEKEHIESLIQKYHLEDFIDVCPKISQADLFEVYKNSDIFLFPSLLEISSTSVMEAMYFGVLPICLEIECMEYIFDNDAVVTIKNISFEEDSKNFATAIKEVMDNRELLVEKRKSCANIARTHFSWTQKESEIKKLLNVLEKVK